MELTENGRFLNSQGEMTAGGFEHMILAQVLVCSCIDLCSAKCNTSIPSSGGGA